MCYMLRFPAKYLVNPLPTLGFSIGYPEISSSMGAKRGIYHMLKSQGSSAVGVLLDLSVSLGLGKGRIPA